MRQVEISQIVRKKLLSLKEELAERFDENAAGKAIASLVHVAEGMPVRNGTKIWITRSGKWSFAVK